MSLMVVVALSVLGLALGSFVNALVWRVHEQSKAGGKKNKPADLSILKGRSMCPGCRHTLAPKDLLPVLSWLSLRGHCRYCGKPISAQYPLVELVTAGLFVGSYFWWPESLQGAQTAVFGLWLALLTGLMALLVYDARWKLLPDRIMAPLAAISALMAAISVFTSPKPVTALMNTILAVIVGGGIFYALFQLSQGKWIGGGDVKLGWVLGLVLGTPGRSLLLIFLASFLGTLASLPLLLTGRAKRSSSIPFGPFLIMAAIIVELFGRHILSWYHHTFFHYI
jgi:prepilin signal peptidase PulO-like enzyme (type II secretory pathway)